MANQDVELSNDSTQIYKTLASNMNNLTVNDSRAPTTHSWGWDLNETDAKSAENNGYNEIGDEKYGWIEESQKVEEGNECTFPVRNGQPDCAFYLKTGSCKFGSNCRYNHPANVINNQVNYKSEQASFQSGNWNINGASPVMFRRTDAEIFYKENEWGGQSESNGQIDCKYYSTPGGCKYGRACRFFHKEKTDASTALNFLGLPVRLGEKECAYYMATGSCKYSANCRFHHPDPIAANGQNPLGIQNDRNTQSYSYPANRNGWPHGPYSLPAIQQSGSQQSYASPVHHDGGVQQPYALPTNHNGGVQHPYVPPAQMAMAPWPAHRNVNEAVNYDNSSPFRTSGTECYLPPQCVQSNNGEWNGYQAPNNHMHPAEMNKPQPPASMINGVSRTAPMMGFDCVYPERPGQPECQFFMKTGDCKFKAACKYHHPKSRQLKKTEAILSPAGLPLRPDQPVCTHFRRHGCCKFGHNCRYHHPSDLNPSAASDSFYTQEVNYLFNYETVQESGWIANMDEGIWTISLGEKIWLKVGLLNLKFGRKFEFQH